MACEDYFISKIANDKIDYIVIRWYKLRPGVIPGYVEGVLIQHYFNRNNRCLPIWNKDF